MAGRRSPEFVEQAPHETGFAEVFAREILPGLSHQEEQRLKAVALFWLLEGGVVVSALVAIVVLLLVEAHPALLALPVLIAAILGFFLARVPRLFYREELRELVMPAVCRFLDATYRRRGEGGGIVPARLVELGILPPFERAELEDYLAGRWRDMDYELAELTLTRRKALSAGTGGRASKRLFRGPILRISVPLAFQATVVVARDYGELGNQLAALLGRGKGLQPVPVPHPGFEKSFEIFADRPEAVPELLPPAVLEALLGLEQRRGGKGLTAAFAEGAFFLLLPLKHDLFEFGSLFRSVYRMADELHEILSEATLPRRVIDALHGEVPERLL